MKTHAQPLATLRRIERRAAPRCLLALLAILIAAAAGRSAEPGPIVASNAPPAEFPLPGPRPVFETWPVPPPRGTSAIVVITNQLAPAVPPAISAAARDKSVYSFRAENLELKSALALFARANRLNIVADEDVTGHVTIDVVDLPLERLMQALLEAHDFSWSEEDGLIRVRSTQTRSYIVDYLRLTRSGKGSSAVTLSSSTQGSGNGSGSSGGGMGGGGGGGMGGGGGSGSGGGNGSSGSQMNLNLDNPVEFWRELQEQVEKLLSPAGVKTLAVNRTAGLIQVTDRPSALKRIETFLSQTSSAVSRQVDIEAKLYDVTLNNQSQFGIDWEKVVFVTGGTFTGIGSPSGDPSQFNLSKPSQFMTPGGGFNVKPSALTLLFHNRSVSAVLSALKEQGEVSVISQPRLRTLNNQTAIMKVGTDQPFFTRQTQVISSAGGLTESSGDQLSIITVGTVLAVTPQVAADGWITLDVTPAITTFVEEKASPSGDSSAPVLDIKQSSTIVRMRDSETIVIGGLIQNSSSHSRRKIPWLGDIPGLGRLFQGDFNAQQKKELVIFLTPHVVE